MVALQSESRLFKQFFGVEQVLVVVNTKSKQETLNAHLHLTSVKYGKIEKCVEDSQQ